MNNAARIILLEPYRIVDRGDAGGIAIEVKGADQTGEPKWDLIPTTPRGVFSVPPGLMLSLVRKLEALEDDREFQQKPVNSRTPVPAARLPRTIKKG